MALEENVTNSMNLPEVRISELVEHYKLVLQRLKNRHRKYMNGEISYKKFRGGYCNVLVVGPVGVGKTVGVKEACEAMKCGYSEIRLVGRGETDLIGVPFLVDGEAPTEKFTEFATLDIFPKVKYTYAPEDKEHKNPLRDENGNAILAEGSDPEYGILVIDEILSAPPAMQAVMLQLLDSSRGLGTYKLPDTWTVVACGNGMDDGGYFEGITAAFMSRFSLAFYLIPDYNAWLPWAYANHIHPYILAYLANYNEHFHCLAAESKKDGDAGQRRFPVPRVWQETSKTMDENFECGLSITSPIFRESIRASIGGTYGTDFLTFIEYSADLEDVTAILEGKPNVKTFREIQKTEARYIVINNLTTSMYNLVTSDLKKNGTISDGATKKCENAFKWLAANGRLDYDVVTSAMVTITNVMPQEFKNMILASDKFDSPEMKELLDQYKNIMRLS